jgi:hypothetical protein
MAPESGNVDVARLIAEVAQRHGIALSPKDPVFAAVTLNELVLKRTIQEATAAMKATIDSFNASVQQAENRAGEVLAQQVKGSVEYLRQAVHADIGAANIMAQDLVRGIHRAHSERSLRLWSGVALLCAALLCVGSFWLGRLTALR